MEGFAAFMFLVWLGCFILGIGITLSLPMIWYHAGAASRKLGRVIELLEEKQKQEGPKP